MDVRTLEQALTERGVRVVIRHGTPRDADVSYDVDQVERIDADLDEERHINEGDGLLVRRSGWVWLLTVQGRIWLGHARDDEHDRQGVALDVVRDVLGVTDEPELVEAAPKAKRGTR